MKSSIVLPVCPPFITPYQHETAVLSILTARDIDIMPWFCQNFIQLRVIQDPGSRAWLDFYLCMYAEFPVCPWLDVQHLSLETVRAYRDKAEDFIVESIRLHNYVYLVVDCRYISLYPAYMKYSFPHPILIYGYDEENRQFHVADFFHGRFEYKRVSFSEISAAVCHLEKSGFNFDGAKLIAFNPNGAAFALDISNVAELLDDYLYNKDTRRRYRSAIDPNPLESLGIDSVHARLKADIKACENGNFASFHLTSFHVFYEHKKSLSLIMSYLGAQGYIDSGQNFAELERQALLLRNLMLKCSMSGDSPIGDCAADLLDAIIAREKELLYRCKKKLEDGRGAGG